MNGEEGVMQVSEPTLLDVVKAVWRGRVFVALGGVCGLVLAAVFLMLAVPAIPDQHAGRPGRARAQGRSESPAAG